MQAISKYKKLIVCFVIALLSEIFVFNFSAVKSIGYKPVDLTDKMYCESTTAYIDDIDIKADNLFIEAFPKENEPLDYEIYITDEGNFYGYPIGIGHIASKSPASAYTNIYSYGNVRSIHINFDPETQPDFSKLKVTANAKRPLYFNFFRLLLVFGCLGFIFTLKNGNTVIFDKNDKKYRKQILITAIVMALCILWGYYWSSSHMLLNEASKPHHQQYKELARTIKSGNVALPVTPSEELLKVNNPYDTIYLQANGIEYLADYAFYNGKYYVYFGITPELLIYLPFHLLTGKDFPNHAAAFLFYALFVVGVFMFLKELIRKYFANISLSEYLIIAASFSTCAPVAYLYFTADLYSVPVLGAFGLTAIGLYFFIRATLTEGVKLRRVLYVLGAFSMALVAGCRPQMLIYSLLLVPVLFETVFIKRELFSKKSILDTILICLPYLLVAILVMAYNNMRFGSAFDFGATYSLTNNDMNLRGNSIGRMLLGLFTFLFQIPYMNAVFPFIHNVPLEFNHMGKIVTEHFFGGVMVLNVVTWPLFLLGFYKKELKEKKLSLFVGINVISALIIGLLDANAAGVLQRYCSEVSFGILLASAVMILLIINNSKDNKAFILLKLAFVIEALVTFLIICNVDAGITLIKYNPELFYKLYEWFRF